MSDQDVLLWFDLETTGLALGVDRIMEVGWGVSDLSLDWISKPVSALVHNEEDLMMDTFVRDMHEKSGLLRDLSELNRFPLPEIEAAIMETLAPAGSTGKVVMAGSGVSTFDLQWVRYWMSNLANRTSYYTIDISVVERFLSLVENKSFRASRNEAAHRAVDDIMFSHGLATKLAKNHSAAPIPAPTWVIP